MAVKKLCPSCGKEKDSEEDFYNKRDTRSGNYYPSWQCKECQRTANSKYQKEITLEKRAIVFNHYGEACSCCGESNRKFLTIDHVNNNGAAHRRELCRNKMSSLTWYKWIINNNFPDDLRLQCYNCNCGRQYNSGNVGVCPHEEVD